MAAKPVRKLPEPELMVTRFKSSQQKIQLRKMDRSMKQMTQLLKSPTRSPRKKPDKTGKDQLKPDTTGVKVDATGVKPDTTGVKLDTTGVKELNPDKDKKNLGVKKVVLKPKYSTEVVARTNKRKMGIPQKGKKTASPTNKSIKLDTELMTDNSELSMTDAVRLMEVSKRLTDEDLMEILTCPSPVWWEDPPDEGYIEESICNLSEFRETVSNVTKQDLVNDSRKSKETNNMNVIDFEKEIKMFKVKSKITDSKVEGKKSKLESIVGNIKKKVVTTGLDADVKVAEKRLGKQVKNRRLSSSTEDMYSDISLNEEEILKDLENIEIPIAENKAETKEIPRIKVRSDLVKCKDANNVPKTLPPLKRKPNFKVASKSPDVVKLGTNIRQTKSKAKSKDDDSISGSNIRFISDDDSQNSDVSNVGLDTKSHNAVDETGDDFKNISNGLISDLAEYITVYKIMSKDSSTDSTRRPVKKGKLHHFYKKYKNNKRFKKSNSVHIDDLTENNNKVDDDKHVNKAETNVVHEQNVAKGCDFCLIQADAGVKGISCERCQIEDNSCELCNFNKDDNDKSSNNANSISTQPSSGLSDTISQSCNYRINNT